MPIKVTAVTYRFEFSPRTGVTYTLSAEAETEDAARRLLADDLEKAAKELRDGAKPRAAH